LYTSYNWFRLYTLQMCKENVSEHSESFSCYTPLPILNPRNNKSYHDHLNLATTVPCGWSSRAFFWCVTLSFAQRWMQVRWKKQWHSMQFHIWQTGKATLNTCHWPKVSHI